MCDLNLPKARNVKTNGCSSKLFNIEVNRDWKNHSFRLPKTIKEKETLPMHEYIYHAKYIRCRWVFLPVCYFPVLKRLLVISLFAPSFPLGIRSSPRWWLCLSLEKISLHLPQDVLWVCHIAHWHEKNVGNER